MLGRDRVFVSTMAVTLIAITGFAVFLVRDFQDQRQVGTTQVAVTIPNGSGGAAGSAQQAGSGPAAPQPTGGTTVTVVGGGAGGPAAGPGGQGGAAAVSVPKGNQLACQGGVIRIGSIIPITGPVTQQTAADALVAFFKRLNSQGGINGCQVDFKYYDDGGLNNQQAIADAHKLVQDDQVFAVVGPVEPVTTAVTEPYFAQQGVPVVGIEGVGVNEYNSPVEYSFAEAPEGFGISTANWANHKGCKHMAAFYLDFDFGVASYNGLQQAASRNGQTIDYKNQESISSNSYGTDTLAAQQALSKYDPATTCVINILDANSAVREMNGMKGNSWYPNMVVTTSSSDPVVVSSESRDFYAQVVKSGHYFDAQRNYQPATAAVPEVQDWIQTEGQYFPGFDPNSYAEGSWLAAKIFTDVARQLGATRLTRNNLLTALDNLHGYHCGFTPDLTMTSDHGPNREVLWLTWDPAANGFKQITQFQPW